MGGEVSGDFGDLVVFGSVILVSFKVVEDLRFERRGRGEDEKSALRGVVEEEKRRKEFGEGKAGGKDYKSADGVF